MNFTNYDAGWGGYKKDYRTEWHWIHWRTNTSSKVRLTERIRCKQGSLTEGLKRNAAPDADNVLDSTAKPVLQFHKLLEIWNFKVCQLPVSPTDFVGFLHHDPWKQTGQIMHFSLFKWCCKISSKQSKCKPGINCLNLSTSVNWQKQLL